jgi:hypothetical protein
MTVAPKREQTYTCPVRDAGRIAVTLRSHAGIDLA